MSSNPDRQRIRKKGMPREQQESKSEWDERQSDEESEAHYCRDLGELPERNYPGDREPGRGGVEERVPRPSHNREKEYFLKRESDRKIGGQHSGREKELGKESCHAGPPREPERKARDRGREEVGKRRACRDRFEHRCRSDKKGRSQMEGHQEPERESELRRRGSRDGHEELGSRHQHHLYHEKAGAVTSKEESTSSPTKPRHPPMPVPLDLPMEKTLSEYGPHELDDQDPRLRAELYPLEDNMPKTKHKPISSAHGSRMNVISGESFEHELCPRHEEPHGHHLLSYSHSHSHQGFHSREGAFCDHCQTVQTEGGLRDLYKPSHKKDSASHDTQTPPPTKDNALHDLHEAKKLSSRSTSFFQTRESSHQDPKRPEDFFRQRAGCERILSKKLHQYSVLNEEEESPIERHASVLLPVLEDSEKIFHELVAAGDVEAIRAFFLEHPGFNINCVNYQKISALHVAVREGNEAMVEFLLGQNELDLADCALYAIKGGNIKIVEMILDKIRERSPRLEFTGTTHSVDFADDLTPIIVAAQLGNYEMIDFLIKRGHSIPPVHPPFCKCEACKADLKKYDRLRYSTMKLNLYKAISNPMYIFHTTNDPFERAFELVQELQDAATVFPQFKVSFEKLWQSLRVFTTELIGCCRNAQEVEIILKKSPKCVANHVKFPRLQYAIDLKQKEFVSHPYTQAVLGDAWTGDLLEWKIRSPLMQSLSVLPRIPMLPLMTIMCILIPNHNLVKKWKTPVNKMISNVASYLIFLIILFLESNLDKENQKRGPPNSGLEGIIIVYVVGYIWLNIRTCFRQGIKRFFSTMWHWYDTIMLFLFTMTIIFWLASWVDITANDDIDLPRKYWNALDPELIAEGFFAAAVIMAFFRLNLFLSLNYHLGPLQVSIGKMTLDIFRFIVIFFIIILAWCAGLCRFYQPYEGMVQKDAASGNTTTQVSSFVNFLMTLKTFFWAIFGMSPIESADVIIENLPGDMPGTTIINKHQFTEAVGYIAFALFQFLSVVVVLNMLVACMANTFTKVIDNVTVEWVFGRSQIYLSFMASSVLPPPFNLVPTTSGVKDMLRWFRLLAKPSDGQRARCSFTHCCYIESETEAYVNCEFPSLMSELAQRYIRSKSVVAEEDRNDFDDMKNEINEMKEMLRKLTAANYCRRI